MVIIHNLDELNEIMINTIVKKGKLSDPEVINAFYKVKRHIFLQDFVHPEEAYLDRPVMIKGQISSSSQPQIMALMLEALNLKKGLKVLEIGTASGYNAALMSEIVGKNGYIYTIEIEEDLAKRAARILRGEGYEKISVITGDGTQGYLQAAPYDRIIVTAEADTIYEPLVKQLKSNGIMLIPFNFYQLITVLLKLRPEKEGLFAGPVVGVPVTFVPLRSNNIRKTKRREEKNIINYLNQLIYFLNRRRINLSVERLAGLILYIIFLYKRKKIEQYDYLQDVLIEWEKANCPLLTDFKFEFALKTGDWHLIPIP